MKNLMILPLTYLLLTAPSASSFESVSFKKDKIVFYTPQLLNKKFFAMDFGFVTKKFIPSFDYAFNAFAAFFIAEESYTTNAELRAGELGFKGGVYLPTQPWVPLFLQLSFGYAKTALHERPWFGKNDQSVRRDTMFLLEGGALYQYKIVIFRFIYQINNQSYLTRKTFFSIGANF